MTPEGRELRDRVLTALALALTALAAVTWLPPPLLASALAVVALMGAWEWASLNFRASQGGYVLITALLLAWIYHVSGNPLWRVALMLPAMAWWLVALGRIWLCQARRRRPAEGATMLALEGWLILIPAWMGLVWLCAEGKPWVYALLAVVWLADTAAYVVGRRYGRRRLADQISPAKSWEGAAGALVATALLAVVIGIVRGWPGSKSLIWLAVVLVTVAASMVGDLTESLSKRRAGVKDSGRCLPGHGGILDRIDSLTAAVPVYWLGLQGLRWSHGEWQW